MEDRQRHGALFTEKGLGEKYYIKVDGFVGLLVPFVLGRMYACMYIYIHIHSYVWTHSFIHIYTYIYICVH